MDEMSAFERQMARGLHRMGGSGRRIDPMAMTRTAAAHPPKWRVRSMFGATKLVAAGAIVALVGGFLLTAGPFGRQAAMVPGGAGDSVPGAPVEVTGRSVHQPDCIRSEPVSVVERITEYRLTCTSSTAFEWSDPRLQGVSTTDFITYAYDEDDQGVMTFQTGTFATVIDNEDGAWRMRPALTVGVPGSSGWEDQASVPVVYDGEGAYEGLSFVVVQPSSDVLGGEARGYIIEGHFPPAPEIASTE